MLAIMQASEHTVKSGILVWLAARHKADYKCMGNPSIKCKLWKRVPKRRQRKPQSGSALQPVRAGAGKDSFSASAVNGVGQHSCTSLLQKERVVVRFCNHLKPRRCKDSLCASADRLAFCGKCGKWV